MRERLIITAIALLVWWLLVDVARAAEPEGDRVLVELAITDSLPSEQETALRDLLESQLPSHGLKLRLEPGITDLRRWLSRDSDDALLRVALDAPPASGWRLLLVDATRERAIARTLTGGRRDRAAIEAVCDIVVSAAVALREGLEVASQTVDEAMTDTAPTSLRPATLTGAAALAVSPLGPIPSPHFALLVHAGAGPAVATFARAAPTSWGAGAAISVWHQGAGLEVSAARYLSQTVAAPEGRFAIDRTQVGLSAAAAMGWRRARFSGSLGVLIEVLQRSDTSPAAANIATTGSDAVTRLGPQATASVGVSLSGRIAVTGAVSLGYFPRRIRYLSAVASDTALAEPWPLTGVGALRLEVALP